MKLQQLNDQEIQINESPLNNAAAGGLALIVGIGVSVASINSNGFTPAALIPAAIGGAVGIGLLFFAQSKSITLRKTGQSEITTKRLIGGKTDSKLINREDIQSVGLQTVLEYDSRQNQSDRQSSRMVQRSTVFLSLTGSEVVIAKDRRNLNQASSRIGLDGKNRVGSIPLSAEGERIADFLGVPFNFREQNNSAAAGSAVMDAIGRFTGR